MKALFAQETQYRVLTLWQPWASLLVHGIKKIETRPSPTSWTQEKGVYLIHAASKWTKEQKDICKKDPFVISLVDLGYIENGEIYLPLGQIIGFIEVTECKSIYIGANHLPYYFDTFNYKGQKRIIENPERCFGDYKEGRYAWLTQNPRILKNPVPYKGGQGYYQKFKGDINKLEFL